IQRLPNRFDIEAVRATEFDHLADVEDDCILDMSAVQFIDSSGVGALIRLRKKLSAVDRRLILAAPGRFVSDALDLMRLRELFETAPDVASAVRLLAGAEPRGPVCHGMEAEGVLRWTGEVTAANVEATWELTSEFLRTHKAERQLAIDLSPVPFIDSSGLGLLLRVRKEAEKLGVEVHFKGAQAAVWNVLRIAKLERLFRGVSKRPASLAPGASLSHARMHS
ncbi:MAG TPA: STAS domain-containing protein, partial [Verrucomicrobiae bacterium]|nr:STAS domain-containing protein [Verrucomicrobiae bacterium]